MPRIARVVVPGVVHHVTQRGSNRSDVFLDHDDRSFFLTCLRRWTDERNNDVTGHCLMSNHFHLLLVPDRADSLGKCLHGLIFRYAQYFNRKHHRSGRLWQNRYYSGPVDAGAGDYLW